MDIARAIYKGGEIIRADDESLNYYSYINLGLRCPICGEEVHLKKGDVKKPHFAHFHKTEDSEKCTLRIEANGLSSGWQNIVKGKGQRREIFQQNFLDIIASSHKEFYTIIESTQVKIDKIEIEQLVNQCISDFKINRKKYINYCHNYKYNNIDKNINLNFKLQIVCEAIEYLFLSTSSRQILRKIAIYSIGIKPYNNICQSIIVLLLKVDWLKYFSKITVHQYNLKQKNKEISYKKNIILKSKLLSNSRKDYDLKFDVKISPGGKLCKILDIEFQLSFIREISWIKTVSIEKASYVLKLVNKSIQCAIFENSITIRGYEVEVQPCLYKRKLIECLVGEVFVPFVYKVKGESKTLIIKLGQMTFDNFIFYPDVRQFLVVDCGMKEKELEKVEKDCIKAWCTVPKIKTHFKKKFVKAQRQAEKNAEIDNILLRATKNRERYLK